MTANWLPWTESGYAVFRGAFAVAHETGSNTVGAPDFLAALLSLDAPPLTREILERNGVERESVVRAIRSMVDASPSTYRPERGATTNPSASELIGTARGFANCLADDALVAPEHVLLALLYLPEYRWPIDEVADPVAIVDELERNGVAVPPVRPPARFSTD